MSDQDFFFDDEDEKPAKADKKASRFAPKKGSRPSAPAVPGSFWRQSVTMTVTGLVALIALLLGVIVGIVLPVGDITDDVPPPSSDFIAPTLTPEQLESGQLPSEHPPLDGTMEVIPDDDADGLAGETATDAADEASSEDTVTE